MTDDEIQALCADGVLWSLAVSAGMPDESSLLKAEELLLEATGEDGSFGVEVWSRFQYEDPFGQLGYAHLPGRLDRLIPKAVRDHTNVEIGDELAH